MWIISKNHGIFNANQYKHIHADYDGKVVTDDGEIISYNLNALSNIMEAIKNNDNYVEVE